MANKLTDEMMAEIERKAQAGQALTNPTAEKQYYYDSIVNKNNQAQNKPTWDSSGFETTKPPSYTSAYDKQMNDLMNQIMNKPDFSYDSASDPLYQQYKEQYNREGDRAMKNTMSEAAALTGGRTNSWAVTAGSQAQDYYNQKLNDKMPELQQLAYSMYNDKYNQMYNQMNMLNQMDQKEYQRYQDTYNRWQDDYNRGYGQYMDSMNMWQNDRNFNHQTALDRYQVGYQGERDTIADDRYNTEWDYNTAWKDKEWENMLSQQGLQQSNWEKEFGFKQQQAALDNAYRQQALASRSSGGGSSRSGGGKSGSSGSSKPRFSDSEIKSKITAMQKEEVVTGTDRFGNPIKGKKYSDNDIIEMMAQSASDEQMDKYMDYFDLEFDEKKYYMKDKGKGSQGGGGSRDTWLNMTR